MLQVKRVGLVVVMIALLSGIGFAGQPVSLAQGDGVTVYGVTHQQPDGNRVAPGQGSLPDAVPLDIELEGAPQWVVAAPQGGALIWAVVLDNGAVQAFRVENGTPHEIAITPDRVPPGMPCARMTPRRKN